MFNSAQKRLISLKYIVRGNNKLQKSQSIGNTAFAVFSKRAKEIYNASDHRLTVTVLYLMDSDIESNANLKRTFSFVN